MARFILSLMELGVSATVHMLFGLYVFSTAVAADISEAAAASGCLLLRRPPPAGSAEGVLIDVAEARERSQIPRRGRFHQPCPTAEEAMAAGGRDLRHTTTITMNATLGIRSETARGWCCQHGASRPPRKQP